MLNESPERSEFQPVVVTEMAPIVAAHSERGAFRPNPSLPELIRPFRLDRTTPTHRFEGAPGTSHARTAAGGRLVARSRTGPRWMDSGR